MSTPVTAELGPDTLAQNGEHQSAGKQQGQIRQTRKETCGRQTKRSDGKGLLKLRNGVESMMI